MVENCRVQHCEMPVNTCLLYSVTAYLCPANIDVSVYVIFAWTKTKWYTQQGRSNVDESFASRERLRFNTVDYAIWGRLQERVYRSRIRDVNHLMDRLIEQLLCSDLWWDWVFDAMLEHWRPASPSLGDHWCFRLPTCLWASDAILACVHIRTQPTRLDATIIQLQHNEIIEFTNFA